MRISDWSSDVCSSDLIDTLVNTHANGDHTFGNSLVEGARIVTTRSVADHLEAEGGDRIVGIMNTLPDDSLAKRFMQEIFGPFDLAGIVHPPVTDSFSGELELKVGDKKVRLQIGRASCRERVWQYV